MSDSTFKSQTSSRLPADGNIKTQKLHRLMNKMFLSFFFFLILRKQHQLVPVIIYSDLQETRQISRIQDQLIQQHGIGSVVPRSLTPEHT